MRTFWAVRHMDRVEWETVQVRWTKVSGGGWKPEAEGDVEGGMYLEGERRVMVGGAIFSPLGLDCIEWVGKMLR